jgi:hypothetical protein
MRLRTLPVTLLLAVSGCSGGSDDTSPPTGQPPVTNTGFGGVYATRVTLTSNTCGTINVQDNPTTVAHTLGATAVSFTHAGVTYSGTVASDSTFTTSPRTVDIGDGFSYAISLAGRFRANAFEADATVDRSGQGSSCRFVVHWSATR